MGKRAAKNNQIEEDDGFKAISLTKIILPVVIGLCVVGYLLYSQFNLEEFQKIPWNRRTFFWIGLAILLFIGRHLAFSVRMYFLSFGEFSMRKCIELLFIFEFGNAVAPTQLGGTAVSLLVLSREKLSAAKTATIVLYKVVLDTMFFIFTLPLLFLFWGPQMIRPGLMSLSNMDYKGYIFILSYIGMFCYGAAIYYGLFVDPAKIGKFFKWITSFKFLSRFNKKSVMFAEELVLASEQMKNMERRKHIYAFLMTILAWTCKFFLISCLIIGIVNPPMDWMRETLLYSRLESMFVIMAFSPSPGGAGFAEYVFGEFFTDFMPVSVSLIVAFIWRLISYYTYLAAGVIIIPNWINKVRKARQIKS
jgi:glycosyltransferase 2 family protein